MKIIVVGGTRSGKSFIAEEISKRINILDNIKYLATMKPDCKENLKRIETHIARRKNKNFITLDAFKNVDCVIEKLEKLDTVLLDSVTMLLNNEMFDMGKVNKNIYKKIAEDIIKVSNNCKNIVAVTDYTFSDSIVYDDFTNEYRKELAYLNKILVNDFDIVLECTYNNIEFFKGEKEGRKLIDEIY